MSKTGTETVLYSFTAFPSDGFFPTAGLIRDAAGNLYGTSTDGGPSNGGTVFQLDTTGKETVLYSFGISPDASGPLGSLVPDGAGNFYGTTYRGGNSGCTGQYGCGAVFVLDSTGKESVLYAFAGHTDGSHPYAGLVRDEAGNLYGTTHEDGNNACRCGTVFKVDATGKEIKLHIFIGGTDGAFPLAGLIRDAAGNLYGTTSAGGNPACPGGCGTVFKFSP